MFEFRSSLACAFLAISIGTGPLSSFAVTVGNCIVAPTLQCLVDEATAEMERFVESGDKRAAPYVDGIEIWHARMATLHLHIDDIHGASEAATGMSPIELVSFVQEEILPRSPTTRDIEPLLAWARRILEIEFADRDAMPGHDPRHHSMSDFFEFKAHAVEVLFILGERDAAKDSFASVVDELDKVLVAGEADLFVAPGYLVEAAITLGDLYLARYILAEVSKAEPEGGFYSAKNAIRRAEEVERAEQDRSGEGSPGPQGAEDLASAQVWASHGDIDKLIGYVRGLPEGNTFASRDVQIMMLVGQLLDLNNPEGAAALIDEALYPWMREDLLIDVARYYLEAGNIEAAQSTSETITDPGLQTRMLIDFAEESLKQGNVTSAALLARSARAALARESDPTRLAILNFEIAYLLIEIGDTEGARMALDAGSQHQVDPDNWMAELEAMKLAAQLRLLIGEDPFDLASAPVEDESQMDLWKLMVAHGFVQHDHYEEAVTLVSTALRAVFEDPEIDHRTRIDHLTEAAWALAGADY